MAEIYTTRGYLAQTPYLRPSLFVYYDPINRFTIRAMKAVRDRIHALMEGYIRTLEKRQIYVKKWLIDNQELIIQLAEGSGFIKKPSLEKLYTVLYSFNEEGGKNSWCNTLASGIVTTEKQYYNDARVVYLTDLAKQYKITVKASSGEVLAQINRGGQFETNVSSKVIPQKQSLLQTA